MITYPIMLNLRGRKVVVVGAGSVGMRKARSLGEAGAEVTLVAETVGDQGDLSGMAVVREAYRPELLAGARLVFACTDDRELNARIAADARNMGALVNAADQPDDCDFFLPATFRDGDVVLAVGTGGASPGLAARVRDRLAQAMPGTLGEFAALLGELRKTVRKRVGSPERRREIMNKLAEDETFELFRGSGGDSVRRMLRESIGEE